MAERKYYHAYDDRFTQIHGMQLQWFDQSPSAIVLETIRKFSITQQDKILEIGCGEGRDAIALLQSGYDLLATDVSTAAIKYCQNMFPEYSVKFRVLDCVTESLEMRYDFIYSVAVIHMLVPDLDRRAFYRFVWNHLKEGGIALICSMGDGLTQFKSDIKQAFELQDRVHEATGTHVKIASTSCRIVDFTTFQTELKQNHFEIIGQGITSVEPDFPQMMFAVIKKAS